MKKKKVLVIVLVYLLIAGLTSCNQQLADSSQMENSVSINHTSPTKMDFSDAYNPDTDFDLPLEYSDTNFTYLTASQTGYYFLDGNFLYYMDKGTLDPVPLCKRPDCLHSKETDPYKRGNCEAYIYAERIFYDNGAVYALSNQTTQNGQSYQTNFILNKYAEDGTFLGTVYTFPGIPQCMIRHRGYLYYTCKPLKAQGDGDISGNFQLVQLSLNDKTERILYTAQLKEGTIDKLFASGKYLFFVEYGFDNSVQAENSYVQHFVSFNLQQDTYLTVNQHEDGIMNIPIVYEEASLLYNYWHYNYNDPRNKLVYQSDMDGDNEHDFHVFKYNSSRLQWDGTYFYEDNWPLVTNAQQESIRKITVYSKDFTELCEFDFTNVEGMDFSKYAIDHLRIADDYLFLKTYGPNQEGSYLLCIEKDQFSTGNVTPRIVYQLDEQYRNIGTITQNG